MESEPHMQLDLYNCMPQSHLRTTFFQLSNQNERMIGFPDGQLSEEHHADKSISYDGLLHRDSFNYHQDLCLGGTSFGSASDINSSAVHLQEGSALESLRAMYSSSCSYGSSSSVPPSLSNGYDGLVGLMQPESSWRASTSYIEPIGFSEVRDTNNWAYETLRTQNELCLSLATTGPSFPQCSDLGYSGMFDSSQSQRRLGLEHNSQRSQCNEELSLGPRSSSQSAQFPQLISGSKYRAVLQQILSDVSSFSLDSVDQANYSMSNSMSSSSNVPFSSEQFLTDEFGVNERSVDAPEGSSHRKQSKKLQLLSLLQVVDDQYSRCLDEIHTVISAFHAASELDPQLHACFALQSVSFFYKNLRQRISNQILEMGMDDEAGGDSQKSFEKCFLQKQWALQQLKKKDQQLWKPQRGLPERSVAVLRAWMFDNFLHPYPKDAEKHLLAIKSGLSRSQVSNWFINARVRLWKPMVEEMCSELNRRKSNRQIEEGSNNRSNQLSIYDFNQRLDA